MRSSTLNSLRSIQFATSEGEQTEQTKKEPRKARPRALPFYRIFNV